MDWKKIRVRYCTIKAVFNGANNDQEILSKINFYTEFKPVKFKHWETDELIMLIRSILIQLKNERIVQTRDIFNTVTNIRKIELYINPTWITKSKCFKTEIKRVRDAELAKKKAKEEEERRYRDAQENEKRTRQERESKEYQKRHEEKLREEMNTNKKEDSSFSFHDILLFVGGILVVYIVIKIFLAVTSAVTDMLSSVVTPVVVIILFVVIIAVSNNKKS